MKALILVLTGAVLLSACDYIVLPEEDDDLTTTVSRGWSAMATDVGPAEGGGLRIDLTLRNETADWSALQAAGTPAEPIYSDGATTRCDTVFAGTGGHRLAPDCQLRGYTAGTEAAPALQLIYVECAGAEAAAGMTLSLDYTYVTGEYNYYEQDANQVDATLTVNLDEIAADLTYPIGEPMADVQPR